MRIFGAQNAACDSGMETDSKMGMTGRYSKGRTQAPHARWVCPSAAVKVFTRSIVTVMGPTPPGTGVMNAAR